jgi:hypothetical protein
LTPILRSGLALVLWIAVGSCSGPARELPPPATEPDPQSIDFSLYLIGDAGEPAADGEPVLEALSSSIREHQVPSAVVFLGDNIYPQGMTDSTSSNIRAMERRLDDQVDAVLGTHARAIFIPGNHDWDKGGPDGWAAILRQEAHIAARGNPRVSFLPSGGCPGPDVMDLGERLRLVVFDSQWWFHGNEKPVGPDSGCRSGSREELLDGIGRALAEAGGRHVVIAAHHPLASGGPHGGHFTWTKHVFPLREVSSWLWVPLPIIGSAYPVARKRGISDQDQSSGAFKEFKAALEDVFSEHPPLAYSAGHEHVLEVRRSESAGHILVSGAGIYNHASAVSWGDQTLFAASAAGFMRLDVMTDGKVRLGVLIVDGEGETSEPFSLMLN